MGGPERVTKCLGQTESACECLSGPECLSMPECQNVPKEMERKVDRRGDKADIEMT